MRGGKLKDLVEDSLRTVLEAPADTAERPSLAGLMKHAFGTVESRVTDLGSNPDHPKGFGPSSLSEWREVSDCWPFVAITEIWSGRVNVVAGFVMRSR